MRILHVLGMILFLFASPASARDAAAWVVAQKSGDVRVLRNGVQPASVQLHSALTPGDLVATGVSGRAMLTNGDDYVIVAPSSRLVLPREKQPTGFTRLIQQVGTMLYKVKHTGVPHFSVDTPMLAAVVKGTSFTIVVDQDRSAVQVTDGIVEVSSSNGYARRLVERGATVYVGRERPNEIIELKSGVELPAPTSSDEGGVRIESSGDVPLSTISDLTGGLVHEAPTAPVARVVNTPVTDVVAVQPVAQAGELGTPVIATAEVSTPSLTTPSVTSPVVEVGQVTVPGVDLSTTLTPSVITTASITTPTVTTSLSTTTISTPTVTTPIATVTPATVSPITVSSVTVPTVSVTPSTITTSPVTTPTVSTPTVTTPAITTQVATVAPIAVPTVTVPTVTVAPVTVTPTTIATPTVTVPTVATPAITTPTVTTPIVTIPAVTVPAVTLPPVTIPSIGIGLPKGP